MQLLLRRLMLGWLRELEGDIRLCNHVAVRLRGIIVMQKADNERWFIQLRQLFFRYAADFHEQENHLLGRETRLKSSLQPFLISAKLRTGGRCYLLLLLLFLLLLFR